MQNAQRCGGLCRRAWQLRRSVDLRPAQRRLSGRDIPERPPLTDRMEVARQQFLLSLEDKGEHIACLEARKQLAWYLRGVSHSSFYKEQISRLSTADEVFNVIKAIQRDLR